MTRYLALALACLLLIGGAALGSGCTAARNPHYYDNDRYRPDHRPPPPPHRDKTPDKRPDHRYDGPPPQYRGDGPRR